MEIPWWANEKEKRLKHRVGRNKWEKIHVGKQKFNIESDGLLYLTVIDWTWSFIILLNTFEEEKTETLKADEDLLIKSNNVTKFIAIGWQTRNKKRLQFNANLLLWFVLRLFNT